MKRDKMLGSLASPEIWFDTTAAAQWILDNGSCWGVRTLLTAGPLDAFREDNRGERDGVSSLVQWAYHQTMQCIENMQSSIFAAMKLRTSGT